MVWYLFVNPVWIGNPGSENNINLISCKTVHVHVCRLTLKIKWCLIKQNETILSLNSDLINYKDNFNKRISDEICQLFIHIMLLCSPLTCRSMARSNEDKWLISHHATCNIKKVQCIDLLNNFYLIHLDLILISHLLNRLLFIFSPNR